MDGEHACQSFSKNMDTGIGGGSVYIFCQCDTGGIFTCRREGKARRILKLIGNYWLGVMLYVVLTVVVVDLGRILLRHCKWVNQGILRAERTFVVTGAICTVIIMAVSIWGVVHAGRIHTTKYEVTVDKDAGGGRKFTYRFGGGSASGL